MAEGFQQTLTAMFCPYRDCNNNKLFSFDYARAPQYMAAIVRSVTSGLASRVGSLANLVHTKVQLLVNENPQNRYYMSGIVVVHIKVIWTF